MKEKMHASKRVFKTSWFTKAAKKARIKDEALCAAIRQVINGQAVDLGGGIFKKRLNENKHRSIILAKGGCFWVYEFLFAKNDLDNIDDNELESFRALAKTYADLSEKQVEQLLKDEAFVEICNDNKT